MVERVQDCGLNLKKIYQDWGGWTLFGKTLERIKSTIFDYPIIATNSEYLNLVKKHLLKYKVKKYKIILEPFKKNTASAILSSALFKDIPFNQPTQAMPDDVKNEDSITAYRDYYVKYKKDFATWKTSIPEWYSKGINANL